MRTADPDHEAIFGLRSRASAATHFHLRAMGALRNAASALDGSGVGYVAVKGPILASLAKTSAARRYGDLDLLVTPKDLERAIGALIDGGAALLPYGGWQHFFETKHAQIPLALAFDIQLDLHWHLCSRPQMRRSWSVEPAEDLLGRAVSIATEVGDIRVLRPSDMLVHTAGHAAWSGGDRLGWVADVDAVVRAGAIDWDDVVRTSKAWGIAALVGQQLSSAKRLALSDIPSEVIAELHGGGYGILLRSVDRLGSKHAAPSHLSPRRLVRLHARSGALTTLAAMALRTGPTILALARGQLGTDPEVRPAGPADEQWRTRYLDFALSERSTRPSGNLLPRGPSVLRSLPWIIRTMPAVLRARARLRGTRDIRAVLVEHDRATRRQRRAMSPEELRIGVDRSLRIIGPRVDGCVPRSLALFALLSERGERATFVSGVRREGETLKGHAWILLDGVPLEAPETRQLLAEYREQLAFENTAQRAGRRHAN